MRLTFLSSGPTGVESGYAESEDWFVGTLESLGGALARSGHEVRIFDSRIAPGSRNGVLYGRPEMFNPLEPAGIFVLIGEPHDWLPVIAAERKLYWAVDIPKPEWEPMLVPFLDAVLCPSGYDQKHLRATWPSVRSVSVVPPLGPMLRPVDSSDPQALDSRSGLALFPGGAQSRTALLLLDPDVLPDMYKLIALDPGDSVELLNQAASIPGVERVSTVTPDTLRKALTTVAAAWWLNPTSHAQRLQVIAGMSMAIVPIGPASGWFPEIVGEAGLLLPSGTGCNYENFGECAKAVCDLLTNRAEIIARASKAKDLALANYAPDAVASRFLEAAIGRSQTQSQPVAAVVTAQEAAESPPPPAGRQSAIARSVCVVVPLHNQARYLARALGSATWQLRPRDEIIVVDDASTDLGRFDPDAAFRQRVMWMRNPEQKGVSYSRNRAIERSRAEWIKFLDADDLLAPFALDVVRCLEPPLPPDVVLVTGGCHRIVDGRHRDYLNGAGESIPRILQENPMLPSATFVRRGALLEIGLFDERIDHEEDWDLWLRLHQRFGPESFVVVDQPICYYCISTQDRRSVERKGTVDGVPVREYLRRRYGVSPEP